MKFYTMSELEKLTKKEINNILVERSELCAFLVKNALLGKTIESDMGNKLGEDEESLVFQIKDITYHNTKYIFYNEKNTDISINIYLDGYSCTTKKEIMYEDEATDYALRTLIEDHVVKKGRIYWGLRKNQGLDYINMGLLIPTSIINPDILAYDEYKAYCQNKKATPLSKEKKKKELEKKLASHIEELKDERFNLLREDHCYVPEDKEELIKFIKKAAKKTFDRAALVGAIKKNSDNEEIVSAVLEGFYEDIFQYASDRLKNDRKFIESCLDKNIVTIMEFVADKFKDDDVLMFKAVSVNASMIEVASDRLKADKNLCLIAMSDKGSGGHAYHHISEELKKDKDIILKLVETRGDFFAYCEEVKTDKELLIKAFSTAFDQQSRNLLENTSEEFKNDKQVALAAIKCFPDNIYYIGEKLKAEIGNFEPYTYLSKIDLYNEITDEVANNTSSSKRKMKM
jgi:hypothetical protein